MARSLCSQCERPVSACICPFIVETNNQIPIVVLQHPSEVKQSKGTVALLQRSLTNCQVIIGEDFSLNSSLNALIVEYNALLLFPGENASELSLTGISFEEKTGSTNNNKTPLLVILDGTWKKAYRIFMLSKNLHSLKKVFLPEVLANNGKYLIRKVAKKNALSSLEATCFALAILEGELELNSLENLNSLTVNEPSVNYGRYQQMLNKFSQFNQFQLSFRD